MPIDRFNPYLCQLCTKELPQYHRSLCPRCGKPQSLFSQHCLGCQQLKPHWHRLVIARPYTLEIRYLIQQFKFANQPQIGLLLAQLLGRHLNDSINTIDLPECLVCMPLHTKRLRERGYNQAFIIAKALAKQLNIPLLPAAEFVRIRHTQAQSQQNKITRKTNVLGAFKLNKPIVYKHVALIDDVVTTGQTANQASLTLLNGGVKRVDVWCIARA